MTFPTAEWQPRHLRELQMLKGNNRKQNKQRTDKLRKHILELFAQGFIKNTFGIALYFISFCACQWLSTATL